MNKLHFKCRNSVYPYKSKIIERFSVPDNLISWSVPWAEYNPPIFSSETLTGKPWADPDIEDPNFKHQWNIIEDKIDRRSFMGLYKISNEYPLNPIGRTGLKGRGLLGRWGPNHAADPIITRWKRYDTGLKILDDETLKPILQFCAIQRRDNGQWAIPGGMVDPGEKIGATLRREFLEEAFNILDRKHDDKSHIEEIIDKFFQNGEEIYRGYVDDPRNTDNAWMETVAYNFHDDTGETVGEFPLKAGDDAVNVQWMDIHANLDLYASHLDFIKHTNEIHDGHW